jgi:hypothetical protein
MVRVKAVANDSGDDDIVVARRRPMKESLMVFAFREGMSKNYFALIWA